MVEELGYPIPASLAKLHDFRVRTKEPAIDLSTPGCFYVDHNILVYYTDQYANTIFRTVKEGLDRMREEGHRFLITPRILAEYDRVPGRRVPDFIEVYDPAPGEGVLELAHRMLMDLLPAELQTLQEIKQDLFHIWEAGYACPDTIESSMPVYFLTHNMNIHRRFLWKEANRDAVVVVTEQAGLQHLVGIVWLRDIQLL
mmetsp:Transcript_28439/g.46091  ORF Transcript_28439/g.46091 Transcript_28439/m.46091 type:complete len:199 (-) Transcript_28439:572-1168(-)